MLGVISTITISEASPLRFAARVKRLPLPFSLVSKRRFFYRGFTPVSSAWIPVYHGPSQCHYFDRLVGLGHSWLMLRWSCSSLFFSIVAMTERVWIQMRSGNSFGIISLLQCYSPLSTAAFMTIDDLSQTERAFCGGGLLPYRALLPNQEHTSPLSLHTSFPEEIILAMQVGQLPDPSPHLSFCRHVHYLRHMC